MTKITKAQREAVRTILANSREYDASTMTISRDGNVSARKDPDKTLTPNDTMTYLVGHIDDMVGPDGEIREGW
jgi:hypothetical protein